MRIQGIGRNQSLVVTNKFRILVSYETPVAFCDLETGKLFKTDRFFSVTTSKHINHFLDGREAELVPQDRLDAMMEGVN